MEMETTHLQAIWESTHAFPTRSGKHEWIPIWPLPTSIQFIFSEFMEIVQTASILIWSTLESIIQNHLKDNCSFIAVWNL